MGVTLPRRVPSIAMGPFLLPIDSQDKPIRKRLNASQKRALKAAEAARFIQKYGSINRWATDRRLVDHELQKKIRQMSPEELDRLLREDE